ncbi:MAG TPA: SIMPL domain-containing protein [Rhizomicrobium sp.]|jgi:hypothetical protein
MSLPIFRALTFIGLAAASPALAADEPHIITVTGQGLAKATPDEAMLSAGVQTNARTAATALADNARAMNAVMATLKNAGIPERDIQTSGFSVAPQYSQNNNANTAPHLAGYQVSNTVTVVVENIDKTGPVLDALVASGANSIGDIDFAIKDTKALLNDARAAAVADATARAQLLAHAAGVTLGPIMSISESSAAPMLPMGRARAMTVAMSAPTPVAAGQESVTADVTITWEIH